MKNVRFLAEVHVGIQNWLCLQANLGLDYLLRCLYLDYSDIYSFSLL